MESPNIQLPQQPLMQPEQMIPATPPPAILPPKKKIPLLLVIVLLIVLVGVLGSITYFLNASKAPKNITKTTIQKPTKMPTPTSTVPTKWDMYTNSTYGFSFLYPSTWQRNGTQIIVPLSKDCQLPARCGGQASAVSIAVTKNADNLALKDFIYQEAFEEAMEYEEASASVSARFAVGNYTDNTLGSTAAVQSFINTKIPGAGPTTKVYYLNGTDVISIEFASIDDPIINKILSSFTFTNPPTN